mgnify:CR=1 FL=1
MAGICSPSGRGIGRLRMAGFVVTTSPALSHAVNRGAANQESLSSKHDEMGSVNSPVHFAREAVNPAPASARCRIGAAAILSSAEFHMAYVRTDYRRVPGHPE